MYNDLATDVTYRIIPQLVSRMEENMDKYRAHPLAFLNAFNINVGG